MGVGIKEKLGGLVTARKLGEPLVLSVGTTKIEITVEPRGSKTFAYRVVAPHDVVVRPRDKLRIVTCDSLAKDEAMLVGPNTQAVKFKGFTKPAEDHKPYPFEEENSLAESHGWEVLPDLYRGWKEYAQWSKFKKGNERVWDAGTHWMRATDHEGTFENHKRYKTLLDALTETNGEPLRRP